MLLVTGGAGFIGSHFVSEWLAQSDEPIVNLDNLTYAGSAYQLALLKGDPRHRLVKGDISDSNMVRHLLQTYQPRAVVHLAAETHVDLSIHDPGHFVHTNVVGTYQLLQAVKDYWAAMPTDAQQTFRFLHVSTDEVYGSLSPVGEPFTEGHPVQPNNPYAATKAASDHLVRAWHHTYGLPVITTHGSNSYGPCQMPEKLIPRMILHALAGETLPVYGDGSQVRDWMHVKDHCLALMRVLDAGGIGETYNIGGGNEISNLGLVEAICACLNRLRPRTDGQPYQNQISFVADRPGHDQRYGVDSHKIKQSLGWAPLQPFALGLQETVRWYLDHLEWLNAAAQRVQSRSGSKQPHAG